VPCKRDGVFRVSSINDGSHFQKKSEEKEKQREQEEYKQRYATKKMEVMFQNRKRMNQFLVLPKFL